MEIEELIEIPRHLDSKNSDQKCHKEWTKMTDKCSFLFEHCWSVTIGMDVKWQITLYLQGCHEKIAYYVVAIIVLSGS